tara:strand:+ start:1029 stop:1730 length:702 start_codon:yes stop_codon:yes gene_type:complete
MNENQKLVSVIMSVYNSESTIRDSIESILNQTYNNIEFLILDDSSTDSTFKIIKEYELNNKNINVFQNKENIGLTKSLNKLLELSKGEYIARQDDDDISYLNRIEKQIQIIEKYNLDFCSSRAERLLNNKKIPGFSYYLPKKMLIKYKNPFIHGTLVIKKTVIDQIGRYDDNFYYSQDYKLMTTLIKNSYKFKLINKVLYKLNTKNNISQGKASEQNYYAKCVRKNIKPEFIK